MAAGGRVGGDDAHAGAEILHVFADGDDVPGEFVAEQGGGTIMRAW
jgi:hypothetical protein